ncbi:MAG TPA: isochorismatase family cysteine hydrolase [Longimicrobium sp.]|nr:isochorismatase family cysteine hydrolase [Longimicrobium sp.]
MPGQNHDLHGNAPDSSPVALVLVDVINDLEFPGGDRLEAPAVAAAERIAALKRRAREAGVPVIYANDNFGRWRSDFREVVDHVLHDGVRGRRLAELLEPDEEDYFVLKPKHSAFFATTLDTLLGYLGADRLVLAGITGDICILLTAADAYMRDLRLHVPADCVASIDAEENRRALDYIARVFDADTAPSDEIDFAALKRRDRRETDGAGEEAKGDEEEEGD